MTMRGEVQRTRLHREGEAEECALKQMYEVRDRTLRGLK